MMDEKEKSEAGRALSALRGTPAVCVACGADYLRLAQAGETCPRCSRKIRNARYYEKKKKEAMVIR